MSGQGLRPTLRRGKFKEMRGVVFGVALALLVPATAGATVLPNWDLDARVQRADLIVLGRVDSQRTVVVGGRVTTESIIEVEQVLWGPPADRFVLSQLGGRIGHVVTEVVGTAPLEVGQTVLLLTRAGPDGRRYLVGMGLGAFQLSGTRLRAMVDPRLRAGGHAGPEPLALGQVAAAIERVHQ